MNNRLKQMITTSQDSTQSQRIAFYPLPLDDECSRWIVGDWVTSGKSDAGSGRGKISVELALNGQFLIYTGESAITNITPEQRQYLQTQLHASEVEIERFQNSPFRSMEFYSIDQGTGDVVGYLFDSLRSVATGRGRRQGNTQVMKWHWGSGHNSTRTTQRVGDDRVVVEDQIAMPDGSIMKEKWEMIRKK